AGRADRPRGLGDRAGGGPCAMLLRGEIQVDSAGGSGLLDELRAFRGAVGGRLLDRGPGGAGELSGHAVPGEECDEDPAGGSLTLRVGVDADGVSPSGWAPQLG